MKLGLAPKNIHEKILAFMKKGLAPKNFQGMLKLEFVINHLTFFFIVLFWDLLPYFNVTTLAYCI